MSKDVNSIHFQDLIQSLAFTTYQLLLAVHKSTDVNRSCLLMFKVFKSKFIAHGRNFKCPGLLFRCPRALQSQMLMVLMITVREIRPLNSQHKPVNILKQSDMQYDDIRCTFQLSTAVNVHSVLNDTGMLIGMGSQVPEPKVQTPQ